MSGILVKDTRPKIRSSSTSQKSLRAIDSAVRAGAYGLAYFTDTSVHNGKWGCIQAVGGTAVLNIQFGDGTTIQGFTLSTNQKIFGDFRALALASGSVIAAVKPMIFGGASALPPAALPSLLSTATAYWIAKDYDAATDALIEQIGLAASFDITVDGVGYDYLTPELVTNGGFDTDTNWNKSAHWTISGGQATMPSTSSFLPLSQTGLDFELGKRYYITFDVVAVTGECNLRRNTTAVLNFSTTGPKAVIYDNSVSAGAVQFARNTSPSSCIIDNVSVREVLIQVGNMQLGSTSGADTNDPLRLPWYDPATPDVTVDGVGYDYISDALITNGTFDSDLTGWVESNSGTTAGIIWNSGVVSRELSAGNFNRNFHQVLVTVIGGLYELTFDIDEISAGYIRLSSGGDIEEFTTPGSKQVIFTAGSTTLLLYMNNATICKFDNVSVREVAVAAGDYVRFPGITGNYISGSTIALTGDRTYRARLQPDDWSDGNQAIHSQREGTSEWTYRLNSSGGITLLVYNSVDTLILNRTSSANLPFTDGQIGWIQVILDLDSGSGDYALDFEYSSDGVSWTALGSTLTGTTFTPKTEGSSISTLGVNSTASASFQGKLYEAIVFDDITQTNKVLHWKASSMFQGGGLDDAGAGLWFINRTATGAFSQLVSRPITQLHTDDYGEVADHALLNFNGTDDFTICFYGRIHSVAAHIVLVDKTATAGYKLSVPLVDGLPRFRVDEGATLADTTHTTDIGDGSIQFVSITRKAGVETQVFVGVTGSTPTADNSVDITNASVFRIGAEVPSGGKYLIGEFLACVIFKGTALNTAQFLTLQADLDTLLGGRIGDAPTLLSTATAYWTAAHYDEASDSLVEQIGSLVGGAQLGSTAGADTNDPLRLGWGDPVDFDYDYVYLNGVAGSYLAHPDFASFPTGDITIDVKVALDDWSDGDTVFSKWTTAGNQRSVILEINSAGKPLFYWSEDGSANISAEATTSAGITDGQIKWVRVVFDVDNGASGRAVKFYTSDDGVSFSQLGSTITTANVTSIFNGTGVVEIGSRVVGTDVRATGKFYEARVYSDLTQSTKVLHWKADDMAFNGGADSVTASRWDIFGNWLAYGSAGDYVRLPGTASNYVSLPDFAAFPTGDIDIRVKVALDDWTPGTTQGLCSKRIDTGSQATFSLRVLSSGLLQFRMTTNGSSIRTTASSVAPTVSDGQEIWIRVTFNATTSDIKFYTSADNITYNQLGSTGNNSATNLFDSTAPFEIGTFNSGTSDAPQGKFYEAIVYSDLTETTKVLHWKASSMVQAGGADDAPVSAGTWAINRTATGAFAQLVTRPITQLHTDDYLVVPDHVLLNFASGEDLTVVWYGRIHSDPGAAAMLVDKNNDTGPIRYGIYSVSSTLVTSFVRNAGDSNEPTGVAITYGDSALIAATLNGTDFSVSVQGSANTMTATLADFTNTGDLYVGSRNGSSLFADNMEFKACVIFRRALTTAQLATLETDLDTILGGRTGD